MAGWVDAGRGMKAAGSIIIVEGLTPLAEAGAGLSWVHWLLESVRARCDFLNFRTEQVPRQELAMAWQRFGDGVFRRDCGPVLAAAWQAAAAGDLERLCELDRQWEAMLSGEPRSASVLAGKVLLRNTRGARYQGVLARYRQVLAEGGSHGHFLIVWAAVGHFFQLSLANVIAECLRLEWELGARHHLVHQEPKGHFSIAAVTSRCLRAWMAEHETQMDQPTSVTG